MLACRKFESMAPGEFEKRRWCSKVAFTACPSSGKSASLKFREHGALAGCLKMLAKKVIDAGMAENSKASPGVTLSGAEEAEFEIRQHRPLAE